MTEAAPNSEKMLEGGPLTYATLDAIAVTGTLAIIAATLYGLMILKIPEGQLAIVASSVSGLSGVVLGGYAGFRWGASMTRAPFQKPGTATLSVTTAEPPQKEDASA